jgi:predicted PurR-regulated permease PerM
MTPPMPIETAQELPAQSRALWRLFGVAVLLVVGFGLLVLLKDVVILCSMVLAVSYALYGPINRFEKALSSLGNLLGIKSQFTQHLPYRLLALGLLVLLILGLLVPLGFTITQVLQVEAKDLLHDLPNLTARTGISTYLPSEGWTEVAKTLGEALAHVVTHGLHLVAGLILVLYLLLDGHSLRLSIQSVLPAKGAALLDASHRILKAYVIEQLLVSMFTALIMVGLYSVMGFKYPVFLGLFNGACSALPVAGPWLGLLPGLLLSITGPAPAYFGWLLLSAGGVYLFKEYVLLPYIIGNALEIHPVFVMMGFLAGMELLGLWGGLLVALPLASLMAAISQQVISQQSGAGITATSQVTSA